MPPKHSPAELTLRILDALSETDECEMEELLRTCAPYTWNVVFLEVDRCVCIIEKMATMP